MHKIKHFYELLHYLNHQLKQDQEYYQNQTFYSLLFITLEADINL